MPRQPALVIGGWMVVRSLRFGGLGCALACLAATVGVAACGSSGATTTSPSSLLRCAVTVTGVNSEIPAAGGTGSVRVAAARECQWSASLEGQWLSITAGASGQGDGTVEFAIASNTDPVVRRGAVVVNGQRAEVAQAAAACSFVLSPPSSRFGQGGGAGEVEVRASSAMCQWTATSNADWITLRRPSGQGTSQVAFDVRPTTGPPRAGSIVVGGQLHGVTQSEGCAYSIAPTSHNAPSAGSRGAIQIETAAGCPWTASSNVPWIVFAQSEGTGPASLAFSVGATSGPERSGSAVVAGQPFAVIQSAGCTYNVQPSSHSVGAGGGSVTVQVTATGGCAWSASVDVPWISIQGPASGVGDGSVTLVVAATTGPARTGSVTIAGRTVPVSQGTGCSYSISPETASLPAAGGTGTIGVAAPAGCVWSATSSASWLSITSGGSGSGNGEVQYAAAATTGAARTATITIAGRTFTLTQGQGCTYSLSPTSANVPSSGGTGTVNVTAADGCAWTATSGASWLTITSAPAGSGTGTVTFTAAAQSGPPRSATLTIAGISFTVTQGASCTFTISPEQAAVDAAGGSVTVAITGADGCGWTAASTAPWIRIASNTSGTGNGTVQLTVDPNTGPARTGTATVAGLTFTVNQASGCTYAIAPTSYSAPSAASTVTVSVTAAAACTWNATSNAPWLVVVGSSEGTGNGSIQIGVAANTTPARTGTVIVAGQIFTVTQANGCTVVLSQTTRQMPRNGGMRSVDVTAGAGCTWTAVSQVSWITVTSGSTGTGNGVVEYNVEANPTTQSRIGTILIGGALLTVEQQ